MYKNVRAIAATFVTLSTTILSLLNTPAYAIGYTLIYLQKNRCIADYESDRSVTLPRGYYPLVSRERLINGDDLFEIIAPDPEEPSMPIIVTVSNNCLINVNMPCAYDSSLYTVNPGDSLFKIARRELGDSNRWREIRKSNGTRLTKEEAQFLEPGEEVCIPNSY
ncbi:hypothetical protein WA1_01390 [Scytonema hofmannii PCC 7110]|uniref:LysM domain-containing protein n=1 Tax=Scytonema hofmannii PCC 7110 TaxID=128403 RepID=A0A139XGL9_9CYAN|nr:LysM domain-containing protein [Scytonema hofmannii]KYC43837.1 hypothetical protein WA1_01390 [Scytonema hofmannii PCC 7110]